MKRATITLTDELEAELEAYRAGQEVPPSLTSLVQVALRSFLAERRSHRPEAGGTAGPSEIAEPVAAYGEPPPSGLRPGPAAWGSWGPPEAPRARDLPSLLAGLPRLSEDDARAMARDLDRARDELGEGGLRDPWSPGSSGSRRA
jgi:hypothetical protein